MAPVVLSAAVLWYLATALLLGIGDVTGAVP